MGCLRQYCPICGEELIHRDNRKFFESSSSIGAILRREGPSEISVGDIDVCIWKTQYNILRILEHKQPDAEIGNQQQKALIKIQSAIIAAVRAGFLDFGSGVFILRGKLSGSDHGRRKVDFKGQQILYSANGTLIRTFNSRCQLYAWLNCGPDWTPRKGKPRVEYL